MWKRLGFVLLLSQLGLAQDLKSYRTVIGDKARTQKGVFTLHRQGEKLYYEIPPAQLGRDFLLVTQIAHTKAYLGTGGDPVDEKVVRWIRRENKIMLEEVDYSLWAEPGQEIRRGVDAANRNAILYAFPVETEGAGQAPVIEVSKLFLSDSVELKTRLGAKIALERDRCFLESARSYPENVEVESTLTVSQSLDAARGSTGGHMGPGAATVRMHYSMVLLPSQPMRPRLRDSRVGYFAVQQTDFSDPGHKVRPRAFIKRWRLEKQNPAAELSPPVKPITFYIDPATPKRWVPYLKKGVEAWQPAFEEAGFSRAIVAVEAPQGGDWSPEDARYSVIRWLPSPIRNAYGPSVCDPRSGEILEADIHMYQNILDILRCWYLVQVGPLDPRCQTLPLPDDLMGELLAMVVTHEVGHSLGLPHNMKASSQYPVAKIRDPRWVKTMSHTPTLMDYSRFNYVAQPGDAVAPEDLIPKVGPYDRFAIKWGYKPVLGASDLRAEQGTLDEWARQQDRTPWLRFSSPRGNGLDPGDQTEAVGDADPVAATRLGLKNLARVSAMLVPATSHAGEDYEELTQMWNEMQIQYLLEIRHVCKLVGGVYSREKHAGQSGPSYTVVPRARQKEAVQFLLSEALQPQAWLAPPEILSRVAPSGGLRRVQLLQSDALLALLQPSRLEVMLEQKNYGVHELLADLRQGLFRELYGKSGGELGGLHRHLQSLWVQQLAGLNRRGGELGGLAMAELKLLRGQLKEYARRVKDPVHLAHLDKLQDSLVRHLDPRGVAQTGTVPTLQLHYEAEPGEGSFSCWSCRPQLPPLEETP